MQEQVASRENTNRSAAEVEALRRLLSEVAAMCRQLTAPLL